MLDVHAVLQAGGRGERLRPLTDRIPKPLVCIAGVPMIERLTRQLAAAGVPSVTVVTAWLGDLVEEHLSSLTDLPPGFQMSFFRESQPLGTLGALVALEQPRDVRTLFLFADLVTDLDFAALLEIHRVRAADLTLASHLETQRLGLGEILGDEERVTGYLEKPEKNYTICSGIAVIEPAVIGLMKNCGPFGFPELVTAAVDGRCAVNHWRHGAFWVDVNSHELRLEAEKRLLLTAVGSSPHQPPASVTPSFE